MKETIFDPYAIYKKGKTIYLIGEILIALPLLYMVLAIWELLPGILDGNFLLLGIVFAAGWIPGIPITLYGRPIKQRGERYMTYIGYAKNEKAACVTLGAILYRQPDSGANTRTTTPEANGMVKVNRLPGLSSMAAALKIPEHVLRRELAELMEHGFMKGCSINEELRVLVTPHNAKQIEKIKTLECKYCGAHNEYIPGRKTLCNKCGTEITL